MIASSDDEHPDDDACRSGSCELRLGRRGRPAATAQVVGGREDERRSEKITNRTSSTIVNCQSRLSTPRRLR